MNTGTIYTSNDYGGSWLERTVAGSTTRAWSSIASSGSGQYLAACVNNGTIYTSNDYGGSWVERIVLLAGNKAWSSIASSSNGKYLMAGVDNEYIYTSNDYGFTWTKQLSSGVGYWGAIASSISSDYLVACDNSLVTKTIWTNRKSMDIGIILGSMIEELQYTISQ